MPRSAGTIGWDGGSATGTVTGPITGISTDNAIAIWDGATGTKLKDSRMIAVQTGTDLSLFLPGLGGGRTDITLDTVNGADDGLLALCGGGGGFADPGRGGYIFFSGNERSGGYTVLASGNAGGGLQLISYAADLILDPKTGIVVIGLNEPGIDSTLRMKGQVLGDYGDLTILGTGTSLKFRANKDTLVIGTNNDNSSLAIEIQNSSNASLLSVRNDGRILLPISTYDYPNRGMFAVDNGTTPFLYLFSYGKQNPGGGSPTGRNLFLGYDCGNVTMGNTGAGDDASHNMAFGTYCLRKNTTGKSNIVLGYNTMPENTTGILNIAMGPAALGSNTSGGYNIALGQLALLSNTTGNENIAIGDSSLRTFSGNSSYNNVGVGVLALANANTGSYNVAIGYDAGSYIGPVNTPMTSCYNSIFIGWRAKGLTQGAYNQIVIGHNANGKGGDTVVLGNDDITETWLKGFVYVNNYVRHTSANYRRYYHMPIFSANPGGSGATWTPPDSSNTIGGYQINAAGELLFLEADIHADWDGVSNPVVEVIFEVNVDNSGGAAGATVDLQLIAYFKKSGQTAVKSQIIEVPTTVGASARYKQFKAEFTIDADDGGGSDIVEVGDHFDFSLNIETDTSEVDDIIINQASFYYATKHVGVESGDV